MRRFFAFATIIAMTLSLLAPTIATAQTTTTDFGIPLGTAVPYISSDGNQIGTITIDNIIDPFQEFDSYSAPQRGYHFAVVEVTITNESNRPFDISSSSFNAIDSDGFLADSAYISYTDASFSELGYGDSVAPGESISGVLPFSLFADSTIQLITFAPDWGRTITVLDQRENPVEVGDTVSILDTNGSDRAAVTIESVILPFENYSGNSAPPRGSVYAAIEATVENTGTGELSVGPADFTVLDRDGFNLDSPYISQTDSLPQFDYADLAPGESETGFIFYTIFQGAVPDKVVYGDTYTTFTVVADIDEGSISSSPVIVPTEIADAGPTAIPAPSAPECVGLVDWVNGIGERIAPAATSLMPLLMSDPSTLDAASLRDLSSQMRSLGDEQRDSNPPSAAEELNTILTEQIFYGFADAIDQLATAVEAGDASAISAGQLAIQSVFEALSEDDSDFDTAASALETACPTEFEQLEEVGM